MFQCFFSYRIPKYTNKVVDLKYYSMTRTIILYQATIQFHKNFIYYKLLLILLKYRVYILYYKYNKNLGVLFTSLFVIFSSRQFQLETREKLI